MMRALERLMLMKEWQFKVKQVLYINIDISILSLEAVRSYAVRSGGVWEQATGHLSTSRSWLADGGILI
jgi:hypothetical protein